MLERFNFYDVYGYLIPGLTTIGAFALPLLLLGGVSFPAELSAALVVAVVGYVVGLLVHEVARELIPSKFLHTADGTRSFAVARYPSDYVLDESAGGPPGFKQTLATRIREDLTFVVTVEDAPGKAQRDTRNLAMMACRDRLVAAGQATYPEQFQGMYGLFRGIGVALGLAACGWLGWFSGSLVPGKTAFLACAGMVVLGYVAARMLPLHESVGGLLFSGRTEPNRVVAALLVLCGVATFAAVAGFFGIAIGLVCVATMCFACTLGAYALIAFLALAAVAPPAEHQSSLLGMVPAAAALLALLSAKAFASYHRFAEEFARSVFRVYLASEQRHSAEPQPAALQPTGSAHGKRSDPVPGSEEFGAVPAE